MNRDSVHFTQSSFIVLISIFLSGCYMEILGAGVGGAMWVADKIKGPELPPKAYASQLGTVYVTSDDAYIQYNDKDVKTTINIKKGTCLEALRHRWENNTLEVEVLSPAREVGWIKRSYITQDEGTVCSPNDLELQDPGTF